MKKALKWIIPVLCAALLVSAVFLYKYINRVRYNDSYVNGNTAGNLYNAGYFCEHNGIVYFANPDDNYCLYSMNPDGTDMKKLADISVSYLNADDHYIYFCRMKGSSDTAFSFLPLNSNSLSRLSINGKGDSVVLDDAPSMYASLCGNYIYYVHYDKEEASTLYKIKIDGTDKEQVSKDPFFTASADGQFIYYNGLTGNHNIYEMNTSSDSAHVIYEGNCWMPVKVDNDLYFMDCEADYRIARVNLSTEEKIYVTDCRVDCYNVCGDYIFFQKNDKENPAFCVVRTDGTGYQELKNGNFTAINTTSSYVYFKNFSNDLFYRTSVTAPGAVEPFRP